MKNRIHYIYLLRNYFLLFVALSFLGCGEQNLEVPKSPASPTPKKSKPIEAPVVYDANSSLFDRLLLSQNPLDYAVDGNESEKHDFLDSELVVKKLFMVWDDDFKASISESLWVLDIVKKEGYKENLTPYSAEERAKFASDIYLATTLSKLGIISRNTDIRAFPTKKPYFYDPKKAGEGYPFDNFQSSRIYLNTPVKIVAISQDGAFYYVATSLTDGWVDSRDVAVVNKQEAKILRESDLLMCVKDKVALKDIDGRFVEKMQVGSFVFADDDEVYSVVNGEIAEVEIEKKYFVKFPLMYSKKVFSHLALQLMDEPYGWGGELDDRDCSMFLRDLFLPFGLYLPRNSYAQARKSEDYIDLSNLSENARAEYIKQKAIPYETLIYMKGHILLYLGVVKDEVVALHDVWGFTYSENATEKRHIVGGPVITTLFMGEKYPNFVAKKSLSSRVLGIRVLR